MKKHRDFLESKLKKFLAKKTLSIRNYLLTTSREGWKLETKNTFNTKMEAFFSKSKLEQFLLTDL